MDKELADLNTHLSRDPVALCAALGLSGKKRGSEYVVELGAYGKGILPLKGHKKGIVLFTGGGPNGKQGGNMLTLAWAALGSFPEAVNWAKHYTGIQIDTRSHRPGFKPQSSAQDQPPKVGTGFGNKLIDKKCHPERSGVSTDKMNDQKQDQPPKVGTGFGDKLIDPNGTSSKPEQIMRPGFKSQSSRQEQTKIRLVQENWQAGVAVQGSPGERYLLNRGLGKMEWGDNLRYNPHCFHQTLRQKRPALMGCVRDASGRIMGLKNIFIDPYRGRKADIAPNKPSMGSCSGGAVQLQPLEEDGVLALAEGIETALGVRALSLLKGAPVPCWSVLSAGGFLSFRPPAGVKKIILYPDGDMPRRLSNGTFARGVGILSCEKAADRFTEMGLDVRLAPAPKPGSDWLDIYLALSSLQEVI